MDLTVNEPEYSNDVGGINLFVMLCELGKQGTSFTPFSYLHFMDIGTENELTLKLLYTFSVQ